MNVCFAPIADMIWHARSQHEKNNRISKWMALSRFYLLAGYFAVRFAVRSVSRQRYSGPAAQATRDLRIPRVIGVTRCNALARNATSAPR